MQTFHATTGNGATLIEYYTHWRQCHKHICQFYFLIYLRFRFSDIRLQAKPSAYTTLTWKYGRYSNFL